MLRVGIISDFPEEGWPSMDLVAEMLLRELGRDSQLRVQADVLRPLFRTPFSRLPLGRPATRHNLHRLLNRQWTYPRFLRSHANGRDLYHIVDHSYAHLVHHLPAGCTLVTCHDLGAFRSVLEPREPRGPLFRAMSAHILAGLRKAALVVCDAAAVRDELLEHRIVDPDRAVVVGLGVSPEFGPHPDAAADAAVTRLLGHADSDIVELLHVGSTVGRKRIDVLLHAFSRIRQARPARLLRVGGPFTPDQQELAARLGVTDHIVVLPFITRDVLAAVYRRAHVLLQPSDAEGFGLPVVEALASGTPVIVSDLPVLRDVGGPAAARAPAGDPEAWARAALDILDERSLRPDDHARRRSAGIGHAAHYSWSAYAARMAQLYRATADAA